MKARFNEDIYQRHLELILNGGHVDYGIYGISDITTETFHAEIKSWRSWKDVIGQLTSYNYACPKDELRAYMYGRLPHKLEQIQALLSKCNIIVYHIELCDEVLTITNLADMSSSEHLVSSCECERFDIDKIKEEIKHIYNLSLVSDDKFCINLDMVAKLLDAKKGGMKKTLTQSYVKDIDYVVTRKKVSIGRGGSLHEEILLTPQAFKLLGMQSKTRKADMFRTYYIEMEHQMMKCKANDILAS